MSTCIPAMSSDMSCTLRSVSGAIAALMLRLSRLMVP